MHFLINGQAREFSLPEDSRLENLIDALGLKSDRVAVEYNGAIIARADWPNTPLASGAKLEIVHFVGGGSSETGDYVSRSHNATFDDHQGAVTCWSLKPGGR